MHVLCLCLVHYGLVALSQILFLLFIDLGGLRHNDDWVRLGVYGKSDTCSMACHLRHICLALDQLWMDVLLASSVVCRLSSRELFLFLHMFVNVLLFLTPSSKFERQNFNYQTRSEYGLFIRNWIEN